MFVRNPILGIVLGILIYEIGSYLHIFHGISPIICGMIGCICLLFFYTKVPRHPFQCLGVDYTLLLVFTIIMFLRGSLIGNYLPVYGTSAFDTSFYSIFRHCFFDNYGIAYLFPFLSLLVFENFNFAPLRKISIILCLVSFLLAFLHLQSIILGSSFAERQLSIGDHSYSIRAITNSIFIGAGFSYLFSICFQLIDGKKKWIYPLTLLLAFLCTVAGAGRGDSVIFAIRIVVFIFFCFFFPYTINGKRQIPFVLLFFFLIFIILGLGFLIFKTDFFSFLFLRMFEDQGTGNFAASGREGFQRDMILDFDQNVLYWIFGKGINGAYLTHVDGTYMRDTLEWGFMQLILKGGFVYLFLYCLVLLRSFYLGFFYSHNLLCKSFAIMCLIRVVELITFGHPSISIDFFLVWIGVGFVRDSNIRLMDNITIKKYFNL